MRFVLDEFPMAPQSNNMYKNVPPKFVRGKMVFAGGRAKSTEYKQFERAVASWADKRQPLLDRIYQELSLVIARKQWIRVHTFFCLPHHMIFTSTKSAKSVFQKWDASNRIKATHDALSTVLGLDDRHFSVGNAEKCLTEVEPYTLIVMEPATIISDVQVVEEITGCHKSTSRSIL